MTSGNCEEVRRDCKKLRKISRRCQRWLLIYTEVEATAPSIDELLNGPRGVWIPLKMKPRSGQVWTGWFPSNPSPIKSPALAPDTGPRRCEFWFGRI